MGYQYLYNKYSRTSDRVTFGAQFFDLIKQMAAFERSLCTQVTHLQAGWFKQVTLLHSNLFRQVSCTANDEAANIH